QKYILSILPVSVRLLRYCVNTILPALRQAQGAPPSPLHVVVFHGLGGTLLLVVGAFRPSKSHAGSRFRL
ncbi:MAG: hypothetical protein ACPGWR_31850, partial [Ardenticatenaceae bacterium]